MTFSATSVGRFVLLRLLKSMYPDLEFIKSVSIRSAMDTLNNTGYIVVLLKVNGAFDIDLIKHTIQVHLLCFTFSMLYYNNFKKILNGAKKKNYVYTLVKIKFLI